MNYKIINSGSEGNATIVEDIIMIDCGVSFKKLQPFYKDLKLVLLTHIHSDHFNKSTIRRLAFERPTLRFACGKWLVESLINCGVSRHKIDVFSLSEIMRYQFFDIECFELFHDVANCGWKINFNEGKKYFYATDTNSLQNVNAKDFDMYFIEANYENEEELEIRKQKHIENGEYYYEDRVKKTHLSQVKATEWLMENMGKNSQYIFMHQHKEKERNDEIDIY